MWSWIPGTFRKPLVFILARNHKPLWRRVHSIPALFKNKLISLNYALLETLCKVPAAELQHEPHVDSVSSSGVGKRHLLATLADCCTRKYICTCVRVCLCISKQFLINSTDNFYLAWIIFLCLFCFILSFDKKNTNVLILLNCNRLRYYIFFFLITRNWKVKFKNHLLFPNCTLWLDYSAIWQR